MQIRIHMKKNALIVLLILTSFSADAYFTFEKDGDYYSVSTHDDKVLDDEVTAYVHSYKDGKSLSKTFHRYPTKREKKEEEHNTAHAVTASPSKAFLAVLISRKIDYDEACGTSVIRSQYKDPFILQPVKIKIFKLPFKAGGGNYPTPSKIITLPLYAMPPAMVKIRYQGALPDIFEHYRGYRTAKIEYNYGTRYFCFADDTYGKLAVTDDGKKVVLGSCNQIMKFDTWDTTQLPKTVVIRGKKKQKHDITFKAIAVDEHDKFHVTYSD